MAKKKGPTPSRAARQRMEDDRRRRAESLKLAFPRSKQVRVVRVRCEGCNAIDFNPHASGDGPDGEPEYVLRCRCGSETAAFYDVQLAPEGMFPVAA